MNTEKSEVQRDIDRYCKSMMREGGWRECLTIEKKYGLDGYPPEIVSVGLRAALNGEDVFDAVDNYTSGNNP